jgi:hypothetical protein
VNAQKPNPPDRTTSILNVAVPVSSNPNPASIFVKYWWISIARVTVNFLRGKKGRIVVANEFANAKPQLKQANPWDQYMNNKLTPKQKKHLAAVKELPCGVCGRQGESEAHHIEQHLQYLCIPLCPDCHRGSFNGIHGQKRIWNVLKKTELTVLNETIEKMNR